MKEKLTVVVPIYNRETYLAATLNSIQCLKGHGISLILVDNGSSDSSLTLCREFAHRNNSEDFKIKIEVEHTPGACAARNKGLQLCETPYIYFFDSDDLMTPNFAPSVEHLLQTYTNVDILYLPVRLFKDSKGKVKAFIKESSPIVQILTGMFSTQSMILRTEFIKKTGGWNESLEIWQDWELGIRLAQASPQVHWYLKEVFHHINLHHNSISGKNFSERIHPILHTLETVRSNTKGYEEALMFRAVIMEGKLRQEGNSEGIMLLKEYEKKLKKQLNIWSRLKVAVLRFYVLLCQRGAWRIALILATRH